PRDSLLDHSASEPKPEVDRVPAPGWYSPPADLGASPPGCAEPDPEAAHRMQGSIPVISTHQCRNARPAPASDIGPPAPPRELRLDAELSEEPMRALAKIVAIGQVAEARLDLEDPRSVKCDRD